MHIHILGICGTFMGGLAILARQQGHRVSGSDANVYPPMSTQLQEQGIALIEGYDPSQLHPAPDVVVIGNAMSRGNPCVEAVLNQGLPYTSGPQWLAENVLRSRWVLACSGTHGKTTTASMLAWVLADAGYKPGFLIGGVPGNFGMSATLGESDFFVIEADEYDSAFFDKRSKFVHYCPRTLVINNLEFDHADIFDDLAAIQRQFHHLLRTVPGIGRVIVPRQDAAIAQVVEQGLWSELETITVDAAADAACFSSFENSTASWQINLQCSDGSEFDVLLDERNVASVSWSHCGLHNVSNAMAAIAAARHVGVEPATAAEALGRFQGVKRRLENLGTIGGVTVYDDFAHHPTAIKTTLEGLRERVGDAAIIAVIEPRSNTMRMGAHRDLLAAATDAADDVIWYQPKGMSWALDAVAAAGKQAAVVDDIDSIVKTLCTRNRSGSHVVIMSNGGFGGIHQRLLDALAKKQQQETQQQ